MSENPLVMILARALRDAANANGMPIGGYYEDKLKIHYYDVRALRVHGIIQKALAQCPDSVKEDL
jgi:hypothetical protein